MEKCIREISRFKLIHRLNHIKKLRYIVFIFVALHTAPVDCRSQFHTPTGAATGGTSVNLIDAYSILNNPATLSLNKNNSIATCIYLPFQIADLMEPGFSLQHHFKALSCGMAIYREGHQNFSRQHFLIGISKISGALSYGVKLRLAQTQIGEYGTQHNLIFDVGATSTIIPKIQFGMQVSNINRARLDDSEFEYLPSFILAGVKYSVSEHADFYMDCRQSFTTGFQSQAGIELHMRKMFILRAGVSTGPVKPHLGLGIKTGSWCFDAAYHSDQNLGSSQSIGIGYAWN